MFNYHSVQVSTDFWPYSVLFSDSKQKMPKLVEILWIFATHLVDLSIKKQDFKTEYMIKLLLMVVGCCSVISEYLFLNQ